MRNNNGLFGQLFYAAAFGALLGWAIGTLIRRHREQRMARVNPPRPFPAAPPVIPPPVNREAQVAQLQLPPHVWN